MDDSMSRRATRICMAHSYGRLRGIAVELTVDEQPPHPRAHSSGFVSQGLAAAAALCTATSSPVSDIVSANKGPVLAQFFLRLSLFTLLLLPDLRIQVS